MIDRDLARRLGDRHLRLEINSNLGAGSDEAFHTIRLVTSLKVAETIGGQHLIWMLSNLLARQFAVVQKIEIQIPRVAIRAEAILFPVAAAKENLAEAIATTVSDIAGNALEVAVVDSPRTRADVEVFIGFFDSTSSANYSVGAIADGWNLYVGDPAKTPSIVPVDPMPFGPYFAACIVAGEVFKYLAHLDPDAGNFARETFMSLWDFQTADRWEQLVKAPNTPVSIPPFYLAGVGAVGQALGCCLLGMPNEIEHVTIVDRDKIDDEGTNLNRCVLATQEDIGAMKCELTGALLRRSGTPVHLHPNMWEHYLDPNNREPQRADIVALEQVLKYPIIVSCVDQNFARHALQKCWPRCLLGGSTNRMGIEVVLYDMEPEYECLMCSNPLPKVDSIEEIAMRFKGLTLEEQESRAAQSGIDLDCVLKYLASPKCGSLAEEELRKFANAELGSQPSVGFVSAGAGIVLAAQLLKYALLGRSVFPTDLGNTIRFNFLNPTRFRWSKHKRKEECECASRGLDCYRRLWTT